MKTTLDYQLADSMCETALEDLKFQDDIPMWLEYNMELFKKISNQPTGMPSVAMSNHNGVKYENISKFHREYNSLFQRQIDVPYTANRQPVNMYVESIIELGLDFGNDLTYDAITDGYKKYVEEYLQFLQNKKEPTFKISIKEQARDYLINTLKQNLKKK